MLDHLDLLDDAVPLDVDATTLADVHARANTLRRRSRLTSLGAVVAVLLVVAGVATITRNRDSEVKVIGEPSTTTTPRNAGRSEGTLPNGLHVTMTLTSPDVIVGGNVSLSVVVKNATQKLKTTGGGLQIQCVLDAHLVLRDATGHVVSDTSRGGDGCVDQTLVSMPPGDSQTLAASLSTGEARIGSGETSTHLALSLESRAGTTPAWRLAPVTVNIVRSPVTAHLEIPKTTYAPGEALNGTIVFDNPTNENVDYALSCTFQPPWQVLLSRDGITFEPGIVSPGCFNTRPPAIHHLEPGSRRQPFSVGLIYWACVPGGGGTVAEPTCQNNGTAPPLAPGTYQLVFRGSGPFQSVTTAPVSIQVH